MGTRSQFRSWILGFSAGEVSLWDTLGGAANQTNYGGLLAAPMLASLNNIQPKNSSNQHQNKKTKMNKTKTQKQQTIPLNLTHPLPTSSPLSFSNYTSAHAQPVFVPKDGFTFSGEQDAPHTRARSVNNKVLRLHTFQSETRSVSTRLC